MQGELEVECALLHGRKTFRGCSQDLAPFVAHLLPGLFFHDFENNHRHSPCAFVPTLLSRVTFLFQLRAFRKDCFIIFLRSTRVVNVRARMKRTVVEEHLAQKRFYLPKSVVSVRAMIRRSPKRIRRLPARIIDKSSRSMLREQRNDHKAPRCNGTTTI